MQSEGGNHINATDQLRTFPIRPDLERSARRKRRQDRRAETAEMLTGGPDCVKREEVKGEKNQDRKRGGGMEGR